MSPIDRLADCEVPRPEPCPEGTPGRLVVLATSDLHMHLLGFDYQADRPAAGLGFSRVAGLIRAARARAGADPVLLVDNGDCLQGTPLGEQVAGRDLADHPMIAALNLMGYDAMGLGNHDFDFGLGALDVAISQARFPVLCSNIRRVDGPAAWRPGIVLERRLPAGGALWPIRIGLFSVLPRQVLDWNGHLLAGHLQATEIRDSAREQISLLRASGCDLVLALAHTGIGSEIWRDGMENAGAVIARLAGLDAMIAGHTHRLIPDRPVGYDRARPGDRVPMVMPGAAGSHLGRLVFGLTADGIGGWRITRTRCDLVPVAGDDATPEDPAIVRLAGADHAATRRRLSQPVARLARPLHSYFCFFAPDRALQAVAGAQIRAAQGMLADTEFAGLPCLAAVAPSKSGGRSGPGNYTDVPAGTLRRRHLADLCMFRDELRVLIISGAALREWLEMSAGLFHQVTAGAGAAELVNPEFAGHNFDVVHGVEYEFDLTVPARYCTDGRLQTPAGGRLRHLRHGGIPVTGSQQFALVTNSYRAGGGGNFAALAQSRAVPITPMRIDTALQEYLRSGPVITGTGPWRFSPAPGCSVIARTGPGARPYLPELAGLRPRERGMDDRGFLLLEFDL